MFRSRANGPALVGKEVMVWNTTLPLKERWQKCHVVSWEPEPKSRHVVVTIEDEETINIDYTRHAIFVVSLNLEPASHVHQG